MQIKKSHLEEKHYHRRKRCNTA